MAKKTTKKSRSAPKKKASRNQDALITRKEEHALAVLTNIELWKTGQPYQRTTATALRKQSLPAPNLDNMGNRSVRRQQTWVSMSERQMRGSKLRDATSSKSLPDDFRRVKGKLDTETDFLNSLYGFNGPIEPEYNLLEPYTLIDTEAYMLQAIRRRQSLMFRNGFQIKGTSDVFVPYVEKRFNQISFMMEQPWSNFLKELLWNLQICSNVVLIKIRDEDASGGQRTKRNEDRKPIAAYKIVPINTIFPVLNGRGRITKWRRFLQDGRKWKDYSPHDIVHLYWDRKPGHIFGTPRTIAVRDDIFALRRLEENVELLLVHHLFPVFHVKVGTPEAPAIYHAEGGSEVDFIRMEIENMPKEGIFVTDERIEVTVHGAKGEGLDPSKIVEHYKRRIFTGLGVSPIDMGETDTGTRSTAENVSQNLKDTVKSDLDWFCGQIKMTILRDLFMEAPFDLSVQNAISDVSLEFPEIDIDNRVKWENHNTNLFNNNVIDEDELRSRIGEQAFTASQRKKTHFNLHVLKLATETAKVKASIAGGPAKTTRTADQPANQHGEKLEPSKARSSRLPEFMTTLYDRLQELRVTLTEEDRKEEWIPQSAEVVGDVYTWIENPTGENPYTNQDRMLEESDLEQLKSLIGQSSDPDLLSVGLKDFLTQHTDLQETPDGEGTEDTESGTEDLGESAGEHEPGATGPGDQGSGDEPQPLKYSVRGEVLSP